MSACAAKSPGSSATLGPLLLHAQGRNACIDAVIWRATAAALAFRPEDGAEVIATGKLTTYPGRSKYQIVVERMELAGEGALLALLEQRRKALAAEGLFDAARKRRLPFLPHVIGVVTSPTGAVIRDIIHRLEDRCPTRVIVWPVPVQGEGASAKIAEAIRGFRRDRASAGPADRRARRRFDRGSVGVQRGGGGARRGRIANPADFRRRPRDRHDVDRPCRRPSRADPDRGGRTRGSGPRRAVRAAGELGHRAHQCLARRAERCRERFELTICRWPEPQVIVRPTVQRVDELGERLPRSLAARAGHARADLNLVAGRLRRELVDQRIAAARRAAFGAVEDGRARASRAPAARGFARVTGRDGQTLILARDARDADSCLTLHFGDGPVDALGRRAAAAAPAVERTPRRSYIAPQPGLFDPPEEQDPC